MTSVFNDRSVWIIGASSGIGRSLALAFAAAGARCVLSARRVDALEQVRVQCDRPDRHVVLPLDVTRPSTFGDARLSAERNGPIDFLVLASGISQRASVLETVLDVDRLVMETNYFGLIEITRQVARGMVDRGQGRIIVISSVMGKIGTPMRSAYAASKHALHGWFESFRAEVHAKGVRCTLVCPGYVRTELSLVALKGDGSLHGKMDRQQETGMDPDECARRILRAVERGRDEVAIGGSEILGIYLFRFLPALLRRIVRTYKPG